MRYQDDDMTDKRKNIRSSVITWHWPLLQDFVNCPEGSRNVDLSVLNTDTCGLLQKRKPHGHTDTVKDLIAAGCDVNLAQKVKQMTRLALALACLGFRVRLPLPPLAHLHLQYSFRLLLQSLIPGRSSTGKMRLHASPTHLLAPALCFCECISLY